MTVFRLRDRTDAGRVLAAKLGPYANRPELLVLAIPRGGVRVGFEVAAALDAPLDLLLVRRLGVPGNEERTMGAVATGGVRVLDEAVVHSLGIPQDVIEAVTAAEQQELVRRERIYRGERATPDVQGRTVMLVDDGLVSGSTIRAALAALRQQQPAGIVLAVPVAARSILTELRAEVDDIVCAMMPEPLFAVSLWYEDFSQTSDDDVRDLIERAALRRASEP